MEKGAKALVHCRFGIGRTGAFAMAYLMHRGSTWREALKALEKTPSRPQSREQWELVEEFSELKERKEIRNLSEGVKDAAGKGAFFRRWKRFWDWEK
jgi:protein-tyrosine phosphatase